MNEQCTSSNLSIWSGGKHCESPNVHAIICRLLRSTKRKHIVWKKNDSTKSGLEQWATWKVLKVWLRSWRRQKNKLQLQYQIWLLGCLCMSARQRSQVCRLWSFFHCQLHNRSAVRLYSRSYLGGLLTKRSCIHYLLSWLMNWLSS